MQSRRAAIESHGRLRPLRASAAALAGLTAAALVVVLAYAPGVPAQEKSVAERLQALEKAVAALTERVAALEDKVGVEAPEAEGEAEDTGEEAAPEAEESAEAGGPPKSARAKEALAKLTEAVARFRKDTGRNPFQLDELLSTMELGWDGPYIEGELAALKDPWGRRWVYERKGDTEEGFIVKTLGADGKPYGAGEDADIANRE